MNKTHGISRLKEGMFDFHIEASPAYREIEATFFEKETWIHGVSYKSIRRIKKF